MSSGSLPKLGKGTTDAAEYNGANQRAARSALLLSGSGSGGEGGGGHGGSDDDGIGRFGGAHFEEEDATTSAATIRASPARTSVTKGRSPNNIVADLNAATAAAAASSSASSASASSSSASPAVADVIASTMDQYRAMLRTNSSLASAASASKFRAATADLTDSSSSSSAASTTSPGTAGGDLPAHMLSVRHLHSSVQATLGQIQTKTSLILQDQERDLLRSFKTRLHEVSAELEKERLKNESGSIEWVTRCKRLASELDWVRELTQSLSAENKTLLGENRRAARQAQTQEQDRAFLIKQLVATKKENARLRFLVEQQIKENQELTNNLALAQGLGMQSPQHQLQQQQQPQLMSPQPPSPMAGSYQQQQQQAHSSLTPPLTQRTLAAHNTAQQQHPQIPKLKFQSIQHSSSPHRSSASGVPSTNLFPQAPANMRASILAAATTESTGGLGGATASAASLSMVPVRPSTTEYMPPTRNNHAGGGHGGSMSARLPSSPPAAQLQPGSSSLLLPESRLSAGQEARFKSVVASLKRRLDAEALGHKSARMALDAEVQSRTQLQHLLWQCVETVRNQAAAKRATEQQQQHSQHLSPLAGVPSSVVLSSPAPLDPRSVSYADLTESDRRAVVEWMLSQHQVMLLLFDRIFPADPAASIGAQPLYAPGGGLSNIANAVPLHYDISQYISSPTKTTNQQQQPQQSSPAGTQFTPQQRQEFKE